LVIVEIVSILKVYKHLSELPQFPDGHLCANGKIEMGVISGGTAGCALASCLSEDPSISVLLLESGPILNSWSSRVPLISADYRLKSSPAYKWATAPIQCLKERTFQMVSGKATGGTSNINAL
jgi:choline dehydrogenase-like flavoprotein